MSGRHIDVLTLNNFNTKEHNKKKGFELARERKVTRSLCLDKWRKAAGKIHVAAASLQSQSGAGSTRAVISTS